MKRVFGFVEVLSDPLAKCCVCSEPVMGPYWALWVRVKTDVYEHRVCAPCVAALGGLYAQGMSMRKLVGTSTYGLDSLRARRQAPPIRSVGKGLRPSKRRG